MQLTDSVNGHKETSSLRLSYSKIIYNNASFSRCRFEDHLTTTHALRITTVELANGNHHATHFGVPLSLGPVGI